MSREVLLKVLVAAGLGALDGAIKGIEAIDSDSNGVDDLIAGALRLVQRVIVGPPK